MEDEEEQQDREQELNKDMEQIEAQLDGEQQEWEQMKTSSRDKERRKMAAGSWRCKTGSKKRTDKEEEGGSKRQKRRKYDLLREDWGETPGTQIDEPGEQATRLPGNRRVEEEQKLHGTTWEEHPAVGSQADEEQVPPDPSIGEQDGATVLLPPPLSATNHNRTGGGGQDTTATNLTGKAWTQLKLENFMLALGRAARVEGVETLGEEEQQLSVEEEVTRQVRPGTDGDIMDDHTEIRQEDTSPSCPPPEDVREENVLADTPPSMGGNVNVKMMEDDILVTLGGGDKLTTDGVSVGHIDKYDNNDCDDPGDVLRITAGGNNDCVEDKTGGVIADDIPERLCEFKRGWCIYHKVKGDKTQKKVKKWAKKKFGYGWVTSTLVEYTCHLGDSDKPAPDIIQNGDSTRPTALTNSKGVIENCDNLGIIIGNQNEHE